MAVQAFDVRSFRARRARIARWRPPVAIAAVVLGMIAGQAAAIAVSLAGGERNEDVMMGLGLVVADLVMLGIIVAFAQKGAERLKPATLGVRRTLRLWPAVGWSLLIYFAVMAAQGLWVTFVAGPGFGGGGGESGGTMEISLLVGALLVLGVAVTAPIAEELAFRGYLFPALTRWKGPWVAAVLTALLFGAAHVAVYPPAFLPALAFFGFGLCLLFWFTRSLLPCVALHAVNNGIAVSQSFEWSWQIPAVTLGATALALLLMFPFSRTKPPEEPVRA